MTRRPFRRRADLVALLADARSPRVAFVSHCLLNENVRFLGGATRGGAVPEVIGPYLRDDVGIVQLPCPEQQAWGGVLKHGMLALYGRRVLRSSAIRRVVVAVARWITELQYRRLARRAAGEIEDYIANGFEVVEVVGVGASPSCGVETTLDLDAAVAAMAREDLRTLSAARVTERVVAANTTAGEGMFVAALRRRLARRGIEVPFREHDLLAELRVERRLVKPRARPVGERGD
jgi:predicted secreted protein